MQSKSTSSKYISGPIFDSLFIIFPPLWILLLVLMIIQGWILDPTMTYGVTRDVTLLYFVSVLVFNPGHIFLVFLRSHFNKEIFRRHVFRFTAVPILLLAACLVSDVVLVCVLFLNVWWNIYHIAMQTFGFARIYDAKAINPPAAGRRLDKILGLYLFVGPILGTSIFLTYVGVFKDFERIGFFLFKDISSYIEPWMNDLRWGVLILGVAIILYYIFSYYRLWKKGHHISLQKILLFVNTAAVSIFIWGWHSYGYSLVIADLAHAIQYFAIVYWAEKKRIKSTWSLPSFSSSVISATAVVVIGLGIGLWYPYFSKSYEVNRWAYAMFGVVSLLHFWYDGFVWSVQKKEV